MALKNICSAGRSRGVFLVLYSFLALFTPRLGMPGDVRN